MISFRLLSKQDQLCDLNDNNKRKILYYREKFALRIWQRLISLYRECSFRSKIDSFDMFRPYVRVSSS